VPLTYARSGSRFEVMALEFRDCTSDINLAVIAAGLVEGDNG
jgi:hypothetical protein